MGNLHYDNFLCKMQRYFQVTLKIEIFHLKILNDTVVLLKTLIVGTSTHNLCFGTQLSGNCFPLHIRILLYYKSLVNGGIYYTKDTLSRGRHTLIILPFIYCDKILDRNDPLPRVIRQTSGSFKIRINRMELSSLSQ